MELLTSKLIPITVASVYKCGALPSRMSYATHDTAQAIQLLTADLRALGHDLRLSDLFRSREMQQSAHADWRTGRQRAYSPPPGGSLHEAGRAMDIDLAAIGVPLSRFWEIAAGRGFVPIIDRPDSRLKEAWHFECRGSHQRIYDYTVRTLRRTERIAYRAMAESAILAAGLPVDTLPDQTIAWRQSALIRLGFDPGILDGMAGARTDAALRDAGCPPETPDAHLCRLLTGRFPSEYCTT